MLVFVALAVAFDAEDGGVAAGGVMGGEGGCAGGDGNSTKAVCMLTEPIDSMVMFKALESDDAVDDDKSV